MVASRLVLHPQVAGSAIEHPLAGGWFDQGFFGRTGGTWVDVIVGER